jgi:hypothetical protein
MQELLRADNRLSEPAFDHVVWIRRYRTVTPEPSHHIGHNGAAKVLTVQIHAPEVQSEKTGRGPCRADMLSPVRRLILTSYFLLLLPPSVPPFRLSDRAGLSGTQNVAGSR